MKSSSWHAHVCLSRASLWIRGRLFWCFYFHCQHCNIWMTNITLCRAKHMKILLITGHPGMFVWINVMCMIVNGLICLCWVLNLKLNVCVETVEEVQFIVSAHHQPRQEIPQNYMTAAYGVFGYCQHLLRALCTSMHFECCTELNGQSHPAKKTLSITRWNILLETIPK